MYVAIIVGMAMRKMHQNIKIRAVFFLAIFIILFIQPAR